MGSFYLLPVKYAALLREAREVIANQPAMHYPGQSFTGGALWMHQQLQTMDPATSRPFPTKLNFEVYGLMKYGLSMIGALISGILLWQLNAWLTPLAVLVFYIIEVHFLFLFPLLVDGVQNAVAAGIRATYKIGLGTAVATVMPIGFYMLSGLLNRRQPLLRWYIGCTAVLIWYSHEVRARV